MKTDIKDNLRSVLNILGWGCIGAGWGAAVAYGGDAPLYWFGAAILCFSLVTFAIPHRHGQA